MVTVFIGLGAAVVIFVTAYATAYVAMAETTGGDPGGVTRTYDSESVRSFFMPAAAFEAYLLDHWVVLEVRGSDVLHGFPPRSF